MNPLHWLKSRQIKQIEESAHFDADWYLHRYWDVAASGLDPAKHYLLYGANDGRDAGPDFSTTGYAAQHDTGKMNPLLHCIQNQTSPNTQFQGKLPVSGTVLLLVGHQAEQQVFGAERSFLHMLEQATSTGATVHALLPKFGNKDYMQDVRDRCHQLHVRPFGFRTASGPHAKTIQTLQKLIKGINPKALHQNTLAPDAPLIAAQELEVETICHIRELPDQDPDLCNALQHSADSLRMTIKSQSDRRVVNSVAVENWLGDAKAQLLPNTINAGFFKLDFQPRQPLRIGIVGNLLRKKGIEDAISIAGQIKAEITLIGPQTDDLTALHPLPQNVKHLGYIPDAQAAMAELDIVLSLSHFAESYGRTVYEGMAAGRPVICYDKGTPPDLLGPDLQQLVAPSGNSQAVAEILNTLIKSPETLLITSTKARARARQLQTQTAAIDLSQIFVT